MDTKALRQKILDLAIHGKLVPQDPNDEPASVLLERIRAEKERLIKEGKIKKGKKSAKTSDKPHYPFELPKGWMWCRLEELCYIKGGKRIPRGFTFSKSKTKHVYLRVTDMKECSIMLTDLKYIDDDVFEQIKNYTIDSNDLYLTIAGTIGSVGIIPKEVSGMNLTENAAKLTNISCVKEYLLYALLSSTAQEHFTSKFHQVAQPKLSIETASTTPIALPPINEQIRIVSEIERTLKLIDGINNNRNELQTAIKQAKRKILDLAIHGKLVPQDPNDEPATELLKRINPKAEITCDNPQYGKLLKGWCETTLKSLAKEVFAGGDKPTEFTKEKTNGNTIPIYSNGVEKDGLYGYTNVARVIEPCLTVSARGTIGFTCIRNIPFVPIVRLITIVPNPAFDLKYMKFCLDCLLIWSEGSSIPQLTVPTIKKIQLPLPPLQEQHRIVAKIEELFAQLDKIEVSL